MNTYLSTGRMVLLERLLFLFVFLIATRIVNREAQHNSLEEPVSLNVLICTQKSNLCRSIFDLGPLNGLFNTLCTVPEECQCLPLCKVQEECLLGYEGW